MTTEQIIHALNHGLTLNDPSGHLYKYDGTFIKRDTGDGWRTANLSVAYILNQPNHFEVVSE